MRSARLTYLNGAVFGLASVSIWAGWSAITRLAVTTRLDAWDVAALRFGVAGLLLLPVVVRRGLAHDRLGWCGLALLIAGAGAPCVLLNAGGLHFAPAYEHAALGLGSMPLFVALIAAIVLREDPSPTQKLGLSLILTGAIIIVGSHAALWSASRTFGDAMFLFAAFLWACFTVVMRQASIDPLHATALVSTGSLVIYLPIYLAWHGTPIARLPIADIAIQMVFQGILVTIVSLILYGRAIAILGASGGAAFGALAPTLSALFAVPLLGEWPNRTDWIAIALICVGVYLASGGPIPTTTTSLCRHRRL
jgi:drug/metabolite transporter (DMT)-like permease